MEGRSSEARAASPVPVLRADDSSTAERFIVFLDIMGFKDRVARNTHLAVLRQLEGFQNLIVRYVAGVKASNIHVALFSDSVLLFSENANDESLMSIADVSRKIMLSALQQDVPIPLKGAIAKGMVTCDSAKQLYFGQALIDAYMLEENVRYYGVLVHHTAERDVRNLSGRYFRVADAFLRSGKVSHYELDWYSAEGSMDDSDKTVKSCLEDLRLTVSDEPRKYIDNTLAIYNSLASE